MKSDIMPTYLASTKQQFTFAELGQSIEGIHFAHMLQYLSASQAMTHPLPRCGRLIIDHGVEGVHEPDEARFEELQRISRRFENENIHVTKNYDRKVESARDHTRLQLVSKGVKSHRGTKSYLYLPESSSGVTLGDLSVYNVRLPYTIPYVRHDVIEDWTNKRKLLMTMRAYAQGHGDEVVIAVANSIINMQIVKGVSINNAKSYWRELWNYFVKIVREYDGKLYIQLGMPFIPHLHTDSTYHTLASIAYDEFKALIGKKLFDGEYYDPNENEPDYIMTDKGPVVNWYDSRGAGHFVHEMNGIIRGDMMD